MNISLQFLVTILFFLAWLALGYEPWFHPSKYIVQQQKRRASQKKPALLPHKLTFSLFRSDPQLELWSARVVTLLGVFICLAMMFASFF